MAKEIIGRLEQEMPAFGKAQRKVADFIIREPVQSAFYTIDKIAHASNVSTATVVRLAQAMGYSNFSVFQKDLQEYIRTKSAPLEKLAIVDLETDLNGDPAEADKEPFLEFTSIIFENLRKTMGGLTPAVMEKVADQIIGARHVYVSGERGTKPFALYLSYHLDRMFTKADYLSGSSSMLPEAIQRIGEGDLMILGTFYRYSAATTKLAELGRKKGAVIVAVSDSYDSPLSPYADYQLIVHCRTKDFHNSGVAMVYLADLLIDLCNKKAKAEVRQRLKSAEPYLAELKMKIQ